MTGVRTGSRVYWHGLFPRPEMQGTIMSPGKDDDLRWDVMWDGRTDAKFENRSALRKVGDRASCGCGYCRCDA